MKRLPVCVLNGLLSVLLMVSGAARAELPAACRAQAAVAEQFANGYIAWLQSDSTTSSALRWLQTNKHATQVLVSAYQAQEHAAWQADPDVGPGADLLLDAQDFPNDGLVAASCDLQRQQVTLRGKSWSDFTVQLRLVKQNGSWRVDGMGAVNVASIH